MRTFVISDTHFSHHNIIKYCNRPFESTEVMDYVLVNLWNTMVGPEDIVFHIGDVAFGGPDVADPILQSLNGKKILITGNHDRAWLKRHPCWLKVCDRFNFNYKGVDVRMQHHPHQHPNLHSLFLHGHTHGKDGIYHNNQFDMSVENWNYAPVELDEVIDLWRLAREQNKRGETNEGPQESTG